MILNNLTTETRNKNTMNIDQVSTLEMVSIINSEDKKVAEAVGAVLPEIADAVDQIAERFKAGGRIIYCGAGTSGRLGTLDAIELTPTYSVPPERAFGILAGGSGAMYSAVEGAEDSKELGAKDMQSNQLTKEDTVIALAASGRTPYAIGALEYGNETGALTVSVTCNEKGEMNQIAQIAIAPVVGPEVITGSTRMKAGTAQKMVLNMISTGVMIKMGYVYQNLMVNVQPTNKKLIKRSHTIIQEATGVSEEKAAEYLEKAGNIVALAIVMINTGLDLEASKTALEKADNRISALIKSKAE